MKKILTAGVIILAGMGGCKSLDCGCPMASERDQESGVSHAVIEKRTPLTPDAYPLTTSNSSESHHHYDQKTCTD